MRTIALSGPRTMRLTAEVPTTRRERARGLRGRPPLGPGRAMLFERCRSVHTVGMHVPLTVAALDRGWCVRRVVVVPPHRVVLPRFGVRHVLELHAGADVRPGDRFVMATRKTLTPAGR
ncbi:MAG: DUF192 domain-containing protein [Actinomycetota bacterium]